MDKYSLVLKIFVVLLFCYLIYLLGKIITAIVRTRRLSDFSLSVVPEREEKTFVFKFIFAFSRFLKSLVIFNRVADTYDRYIYGDSRLRKGMDYISIKIIIGFLVSICYLVVVIICGETFNSLLLLTCFVLGLIIPDFYCMFLKTRKVKILNKNLLGAIIIMNNSYKANGSIENAICDVIERTDGIVSFEFKKVLNDLNLGMDVSTAFYRMYERVKVSSVLYISRVFGVASKCSINIIEVLNDIEKKLISKEKLYNEIENLRSINRLALIIFTLLPLIFVVSFILYNPLYVEVFTSFIGQVVFAIILILYLFYLVVLRSVFKGGKYYE